MTERNSGPRFETPAHRKAFKISLFQREGRRAVALSSPDSPHSRRRVVSGLLTLGDFHVPLPSRFRQ